MEALSHSPHHSVQPSKSLSSSPLPSLHHSIPVFPKLKGATQNGMRPVFIGSLIGRVKCTTVLWDVNELINRGALFFWLRRFIWLRCCMQGSRSLLTNLSSASGWSYVHCVALHRHSKTLTVDHVHDVEMKIQGRFFLTLASPKQFEIDRRDLNVGRCSGMKA